MGGVGSTGGMGGPRVGGVITLSAARKPPAGKSIQDPTGISLYRHDSSVVKESLECIIKCLEFGLSGDEEKGMQWNPLGENFPFTMKR